MQGVVIKLIQNKITFHILQQTYMYSIDVM